MKKLIALVFALFVCVPAIANDRTLVMTDGACSVAYTLADTVAADVVKKGIGPDFSYDELFQTMFWKFFHDAKESAGLRYEQLIDAQVASMWLRENSLNFDIAIRRNLNKYGTKGRGNESTASIVADAMWTKCNTVSEFNINTLTVPDPKPKQQM